MARPELIQQLTHDKILTKGNFPKFVETFNYTVNRLENLKGDYDTDPANGHITLDNTDPEHPVIRMAVPVAESTGQGITANEPWSFDFKEDEIISPYFQIGTYRAEADTDGFSISAWASSDTTKHLYCVMDIANLSAYASETERNDWNHVSFEVATLSAVSSDTGMVDENNDPIIDYKTYIFYKDRYPLAPVWESYYN